jgi:hypothetical protein
MLKAKMDQKLAEIDEVNAQLREGTVRAPSRAIIDILPVRLKSGMAATVYVKLT